MGATTNSSREQALLNIQVKFLSDSAELQYELDKMNKIIEDDEKNRRNKKKALNKKDLQDLLEQRKVLIKQIAALESQAQQDISAMRRKFAKEDANAAEAEHKKGLTGYVGRWKHAIDTVTRYFSAYQVFNTIIGGIKDIATDYAQVEKALYRVQSITGDSATETAKLRDTVFQMSAGYNIAATEVANFVFEMAKLGKSGEEISYIANGAAALSVVLGEDMVASGKLIGTTLNQFNLVASESNKVAGVFLNTIKNSPQNLKDLYIELQYLGSIANASSFEINELGVMIEYMSNKGIAASKIGTGMRNMLLEVAQMGGTAKEAIDELAKSGINLSEAEEMFGKRGALVAYELIRNWDEVKEMFKHSIPTAIELTATTMEANQGIINEFTTVWKRFKAAVIGGEAISDIVDTSENLVAFLKYAGVGLDDAVERIKKAVDKGQKIDVEKMFPELEKIPAYESFKKGLYGQRLMSSVELFAEEYQKEASQEEKFTKLLDANKDAAAEVYKKYKAQLLTKQDAELEIIALRDKLRGDLIKAHFVGAGKKSEKIFNDQIATLTATEIDYGLKQYKEKIDGLDKQINDILNSEEAQQNATEADKKVKKLRSERDNYCKTVTNLGYPEWCPEQMKKARKEALDYMRAERKAFKDEMDAAFAEAEAESQRQRGDRMGVSATATYDLKELVSPSTMLLEAFEGDKKKLLAGNAGTELYTRYLKQKFAQIKADIEGAAEDELATLKQEYSTKASASAKFIAELMGKSDIAGLDPKVKADIELQISDAQTAFKELETTYKVDIEKVNAARNKAFHDADTKEGGLFDLLAKYVYGVNLGAIADEKERLKAVQKRNEDYMRAAQNYLSDVVDIYKTFAEEMYSQQMDRLDAQKKGLQMHYDFEEEILRSSVDNQLITQETYENRLNQLNKKKIQRENELEKAAFIAKQKRDRQSAITDGIVQGGQAFIQGYLQGGGNPVLGAILGAIGAAVVVAQTAVKISGINKREFVPVKYADGGMVNGASHSQGGVPFNVNGVGGYEMEGGEYIIKKSSVNRHTLPLLDAINNDKRYDPSYFANGGVVSTPVQPQTQSIVRALITEKDLDAYFKNKDFNDGRKKLFG